tara:strand:+ start:105 stop:359 length:255 start_codon:yes stop_codon:yes gene_type:complete
MFDFFIITIWLEFNDKLHQRYEFPVIKTCNKQSIQKVINKYEKTDAKIIAVKCMPDYEFKANKYILSNQHKHKLKYFVEKKKLL